MPPWVWSLLAVWFSVSAEATCRVELAQSPAVKAKHDPDGRSTRLPSAGPGMRPVQLSVRDFIAYLQGASKTDVEQRLELAELAQRLVEKSLPTSLPLQISERLSPFEVYAIEDPLSSDEVLLNWGGRTPSFDDEEESSFESAKSVSAIDLAKLKISRLPTFWLNFVGSRVRLLGANIGSVEGLVSGFYYSMEDWGHATAKSVLEEGDPKLILAGDDGRLHFVDLSKSGRVGMILELIKYVPNHVRDGQVGIAREALNNPKVLNDLVRLLTFDKDKLARSLTIVPY